MAGRALAFSSVQSTRPRPRSVDSSLEVRSLAATRHGRSLSPNLMTSAIPAQRVAAKGHRTNAYTLTRDTQPRQRLRAPQGVDGANDPSQTFTQPKHATAELLLTTGPVREPMRAWAFSHDARIRMVPNIRNNTSKHPNTSSSNSATPSTITYPNMASRSNVVPLPTSATPLAHLVYHCWSQLRCHDEIVSCGVLARKGHVDSLIGKNNSDVTSHRLTLKLATCFRSKLTTRRQSRSRLRQPTPLSKHCGRHSVGFLTWLNEACGGGMMNCAHHCQCNLTSTGRVCVLCVVVYLLCQRVVRCGAVFCCCHCTVQYEVGC